MGLTTIVQKSHATPVVLVGAAFVFGNLSVFLVSTLKEMQAKSHTPGGVDWFDFAILLAGVMGSIAINIAAYMNKGYTRWADVREQQHAEERKAETGRVRRANVNDPTTVAEGHLQ